MTTTWLLEGSIAPTYPAAQVQALTGASAADLQNWANRDLIKPVANKPGKGGRRLYSKTDVIIVRIAKWLSPLGFETNQALGIAGAALGALLDHVRARRFAGMRQSEFLKLIYGAVALVAPKAGEHGDYEAEIVSALKLPPARVLAHVLGDRPTLVLPIGRLILETELAERAMPEKAD